MSQENVNLLYNPNFKFMTKKIPGVEYFCASVNFPSISIGEISIPTPTGINHNTPANGIQYTELSADFLVDEDLNNYFELYNWMIDCAIPGTKNNPKPYPGGVFKPQEDLVLMILDNNLNAKYSITFVNAFPTVLGQISFDSAIDQPTPQKVNVSFRFDYYYKTDSEDIGR